MTTGRKELTPYGKHCDQWAAGCGSVLCHGATKVVLCRGSLPCDILFVGEAPGESEDVIGRPFVGPAGVLLDRIVGEALDGLRAGSHFRLAFTNLVGCVPRGETGRPTDPSVVEIERCRPRLHEMVRLARPKLLVTVGALAEKHLNLDFVPRAAVVHPAAVLRANVANQGLMIQRDVVTLRTAAVEIA
ncbi:MAG: uracil-DNA glycosylase family protein [Fimbriiglobus sp.]